MMPKSSTRIASSRSGASGRDADAVAVDWFGLAQSNIDADRREASAYRSLHSCGTSTRGNLGYEGKTMMPLVYYLGPKHVR
jgi:hypothetical protein